LRDGGRDPDAPLNVQVTYVALMPARAHEAHDEPRCGEFPESGVFVDLEGFRILRHAASVLRGRARPASRGRDYCIGPHAVDCAQDFQSNAGFPMDWGWLLTWVKSDTVKGAVIGGGIALFGSILANRNSRKQLRIQVESGAKAAKIAREFEAESARVAREFETRRAVYQDAAIAIAKIGQTVGGMSNLEMADKEILETSIEAFSTLAKVQLVARLETVWPLLDFSQAAGLAAISLWPTRAVLMQRKVQMDAVQKVISDCIADGARWVQAMAQENLKETPDRVYFGRLQRQFKGAEERRVNFENQYSAMALQQRREQSEFALKCICTNREMQRAIPALWGSSRRELHLEADEVKYGSKIDEQFQAMIAALEELRQRVLPAANPPPPPKDPDPGAA
jgi:hypothetical protein